MADDPLLALRERFRIKAITEAGVLRDAMERSDLELVERIVHGLAGAAAIFGFTEISARALSIDSDFAAGRAPDARQVEALVQHMRQMP